VPNGCRKIITPSSTQRKEFPARRGEIDTPDVGAEFNAAEAELLDGAVQLSDGHAGVLQRHGAHAHQPVGMLCNHAGDVIVDHMAAIARHFRRRGIDEMAGIGRDHLHVDAVAVHVGKTGVEIGQLRKIDPAALRLDAFGEVVDMRVGIRRYAAAGNARGLQHHRVRLGHHAVAVNVDGAPPFGFAGAPWRAAMIGRGPAGLALKQHVKSRGKECGVDCLRGAISLPPPLRSPGLRP
jgi:hypothetical protein